MSTELIELDVQGSFAWITICRPEKKNALSYAMWQRMRELVVFCEENPAIRYVIFRGEGREAFSSGADIAEFGRVRFDESSERAYDRAVQDAVWAIYTLHKVSVAMIYGFCVGGGAELAIAADFRFAADTVKMGITPARLGIVYGPQETQMLVNLIGPSRAKDLLFTGRLIAADEALAMGLVDRVVPEENLENQTLAYLAGIEKNVWPAVESMKTVVNQLTFHPFVSPAEFEKLVEKAHLIPDYQERVRAFLRKSLTTRHEQ